MKNIFIGICIFVAVSITGLGDEIKVNIQRILVHLPEDYSVITEDTNHVITIDRLKVSQPNKGIIRKWINKKHRSAWDGTAMTQIIVADVPKGQPMYVHLVGEGSYVTATIHIHSVQEINGGEWETSEKYPKKSQTVVLE